MAVSGNTQAALNANMATIKDFRETAVAAELRAAELRHSGEYRSVQIRRWNNGSRAAPRWEYMVLAWRASR